MGRGYPTDEFDSEFPGRSTVDWMRPSDRKYTTVQYSPFDSSDVDPTAFRKNAFSFDPRGGHQPRDYRHYNVNDNYGERDSGYTQRGRGNSGSYDRSDGSSSGYEPGSRLRSRSRSRRDRSRFPIN